MLLEPLRSTNGKTLTLEPVSSTERGRSLLELKQLYRSLFLIRHVEEEIERIYPTDAIKSPVHLSIGQEAAAVGVIANLRPADVVFGTYRGHAAYLARGGDLKGMWAELYGKDAGVARGKGGSMHLVDVAHGVMGMSAVVGTTVPHAVGYAHALRQRASDSVVVSFFGDGATDEGVWYESLNAASVWNLPVLFVCENNGLAIHQPLAKRQAGQGIGARASVLGIPSTVLPDDDVFQLLDVTRAAVEDLRRGGGPQLLEIPVYRWRRHVGPGDDFDAGYRDRGGLEQAVASDQVKRVAEMLPAAVREKVETDVRLEVADAVAFAEQAPWPPIEELWRGVYAPADLGLPSQSAPPPPLPPAGARRLRYAAALAEATAQEMARDPRVYVVGLDVDDHLGIYDTTTGLAERFGERRCFSTPLAENAMTGFAIGSAMAGMRPIHVHIRQDFLMLAMDQIINIAAKAHYMYGGQVQVPLVVRAVIGKSWGQGAQHSQALQALFAHIPGLRVAMPTTPYDAKGTLIAAIRDNNPVLFLEHRTLHRQEGYVPEEQYTVPLGQARVLAPGQDISIVAISWMAVEAMRARAYLATQGISAEVVDPVTISPLDIATIRASAAKTGRVLVVDCGWVDFGVSAEIVAQLTQGRGQRPEVYRMGFEPTPCPPSPPLEHRFYPNGTTIAHFVHTQILGGDPAWVPDAPIYPEQLEFRGPF